MAAAAIRKIAATVDGVLAIIAVKVQSASIRVTNPGWRTLPSKATVFPRSSRRQSGVPAKSHDIVPAIDTVSPLVSGSPDVEGVANGFHPRPRRRRRGKAEMGIDEAQGGSEGSANESIQD